MLNKEAALESLLFVAGDEGLTVQEITSLLEVAPLEVHNLISRMRKKYEKDATSGLTLLETRKRYQLVTKKEYAEVIKQFAISPFASHLSQAALETLAIVAYKQPITRVEIDEIRGVQSSSLLQRLLLRGLVKEMGREETPGRPIIYGTTDYFMNYFGLTDMKELPDAELLFQMQEDDTRNLFEKESTESLLNKSKASFPTESSDGMNKDK